jgi:hypothetical protein
MHYALIISTFRSILHFRLRNILSALDEWTPSTYNSCSRVVLFLSPTCHALNGPSQEIGVDSKVAAADDSLASRLISPKATAAQQVADVRIVAKEFHSNQEASPAFYNNDSDSLAVDVLWGDKKLCVRSEKLNAEI